MNKIFKKTLIIGFAWVVVSSLFLGFFHPVLPTRGESKNETDKIKDEIEDDIDEIQKKLKKEEAARQQLRNQLNQIQHSVSITQQEIKKTQSYINETEENIARYENEIKNFEERNKLQKKILASVLRQIYYNQNNSIEIKIIKHEKNNQFLGDNDKYAFIERKVITLMEEIKKLKSAMEQKKEKLREEKSEHERLLDLKHDQQRELLSEKISTQSGIAQKEATIEELNTKLTSLRSNLSSLLGKSFNAEDIEEAAKFSSKVSGVRKDFIMGMLVVESDLGRFTGGCLAKDSRMSGERLEIFKNICEELNYNWRKMKVSCPPRGYRGTGGAMGVAQFMSDTWMGYKDKIASVTGHNPPDPWNLTDGVVAMGLKLAKGGATSKSGECNAAKLYLSGTTSPKYNWYCQKVLYWADNYERLLK